MWARDTMPYILRCCANWWRMIIHSIITKMLVYWWHIRVGDRLKAYGIPIFQKHPTGTIDIGNNIILRSAEWSNTVGLNHRCTFSASRNAKITIGDDCGFSATAIAAASSITIGNRVGCGANCTITDTDHHLIDPLARAENKPANSAAIVIEDDVWLGMNVVVLKGVTIGRGTIVAANGVVTKSLPSNVIAAGVPARVIKRLSNQKI